MPDGSSGAGTHLRADQGRPGTDTDADTDGRTVTETCTLDGTAEGWGAVTPAVADRTGAPVGVRGPEADPRPAGRDGAARDVGVDGVPAVEGRDVPVDGAPVAGADGDPGAC